MLREIYEQPAAIARTLEYYLDLVGIAAGLSRGTAARGRRAAPHAWPNSSSPPAAPAATPASPRRYCSKTSPASSSTSSTPANTHAAPSTLRRHPQNPSPVLVLSQSGETADTLAALREAARRGHPTIAVTNVHGIDDGPRSDIDLATLAGVELAIPATKSFTTQLALINVLALLAARERNALSARTRSPRASTALAQVSEAIAAQLPAWERSIGHARASLF